VPDHLSSLTYFIISFLYKTRNRRKKRSAVWRSAGQYASDYRPMTLCPHLTMSLPFRNN